MMKRLGTWLLGLVIVVASLAFASPAEASVYGCADAGHVCFYNYQSYNAAGGIYDWNLRTGFGSCHVLPTSGISGWTNGKVYNAASSLLINNTGTNNLTRFTISFFDSNACNFGGDYYFQVVVDSGDLTGYTALVNQGWNDRIGSFIAVHS